MMVISKAYYFDSSHRLWQDDWSAEKNEKIFGKCAREHGHTYRLEVSVSGPVDKRTGMVLNYFDLDAIVKPIVEHTLDHRNLNDVFEELTTAENMTYIIAQWIRHELAARYEDIFVAQVTLQETPKTRAVWRP